MKYILSFMLVSLTSIGLLAGNTSLRIEHFDGTSHVFEVSEDLRWFIDADAFFVSTSETSDKTEFRIDNVRRLSYFSQSKLEDVSFSSIKVVFVERMIVVTHAPAGTTITISAINGTPVFCKVSDGESTYINSDIIPTGAYILTVGTSYKLKFISKS